MSELVLMPTPNWFTSKPIDICQTDGTIAFSAICSILLTNNLTETYNSTIKDAHSKRILSLSFYRGDYTSDGESTRLLASCGEDMEVKVWNIKTGGLINQHKLHQNMPVCVDWLSLDELTSKPSKDPILISCDLKGNIFKYNLNSNTHTRYFPENKPISQLKTCPGKHLVAVGYKQGTIVILDIKNDQMKIVHKLKNHEDNINCLHWFPSLATGTLNDEICMQAFHKNFKSPDSSLILCSSSEDKTIRFWCCTSGEQMKCIKAPGISTGAASSSQNRATQKSTANIAFTPLSWPTPKCIVSGSFKGELYAYDLIGCDDTKTVQWQPFTALQAEKSHKKIVYEISSYKNKIVSLSLDRYINTWNFDTLKQESSMSTLNGYVYSIASSPIDSNVLAISVGDSSIKLLNEKQNRRVTKSLGNNIKSEVTQICWHPTKENIIAFGTKDGKVGLIDTIANNKPAQYVYTTFNQSVYTLLWSYPIICNEEEPTEGAVPSQPEVKEELAWRKTTPSSKSNKAPTFALYSVADGKIIQHNIQFQSGQGMTVNPNSQSLNLYNRLLNVIGQRTLKESDESNPDSEIGANSLRNKTNFEYGLTEFSVLIPNKTTDHRQYPGLIYFVVGKFDGSMEMFKKTRIEGKDTITRLCTLYNHQKLITCSKWNKREVPDLIATGSNDFNVIIIDFKQMVAEIEKASEQTDLKFYGKFRHKLVGHRERITSLSWSSREDFNMLASCSYDSTVQIWNVDDGTPICNYRGHSEKILCCLFSSSDLNSVYSGGEDYSLHKWKIDQQKDLLPPEECSILVGKKKTRSAKKTMTKKPTETLEPIKQRSQSEISELADEEPADTSLQVICENDEQQGTIKKSSSGTAPKSSVTRELKSLLMLSSHGNKSQKSKLKDCLGLFELLYERQEKIAMELQNKNNNFEFDACDFEISSDQITLFAYGNRKSVIKLLELEHTELKRLNSDKWYILDIWLGNLASVFNDFYEQNNINDIIFNLYQISVSSNPNTLQFLSEYIDQLSKSSNNEKIHRAVMYALASFDVHKAIGIYVANNLYLYALVLAQLRLPPTDSYLSIVLKAYGIYATNNGDYETAVMCYIRSGDFESAYKVLIRRNVKSDAESEDLIGRLMAKLANLMPPNSTTTNIA